MAKAKNTIERIKFIPERDLGEPAGELLEGEVIYTSKLGSEKVARTDDHSIHVISNLDGPGKADGEWEAVAVVFTLEAIKETMEASSRLTALFMSLK